ncbi:hypothetical protein EON64_18655, partial [archaeon]
MHSDPILPNLPSPPAKIVRYVDGWLSRHMPRVRRWNYDDNLGDKSILLFHVHVYIERTPFA